MKDDVASLMENSDKETDLNRDPLVSIIIPVYNGANYLRYAIDSALNQTYKNLEILVINDGSNDEGQTESIALSYGNKIRYISKPNGGVSTALNTGISNMKGDYFSWLSHDDLYLADKIQHQINVLNSLSNRDTIIYGGYDVINECGQVITTVNLEKLYPRSKLNIPLFPILKGLIHGCSLLIPKRLFDEIGLFDEKLRSTQDYDLWFKFMRVAPVRFDPKVLIMSRVHEQQGSKSPIHEAEKEQLWHRFLKELSIKEMEEMDGSASIFLHNTAQFLYRSSINKAAEKALSMSKRMSRESELINPKQILVSIIIPISKIDNLTMESIKSVLNQNHKNLEVLIINYGFIIDFSSFSDLDERIKLYSTRNSNSAVARNLGIKEASGEYITFLDPGSIYEENKIEVQLKFMLGNYSSFSYTSYIFFDHSGNKKHYKAEILPDNQNHIIIEALSINTSTVMIKSSISKKIKFQEYYVSGAENCAWIDAAKEYGARAINSSLTQVKVNLHKDQFESIINICSFILNDHYLAMLYEESLPSLFDRIKIFSVASHKKQLSFSQLLYWRIKQVVKSLKHYGILHTMSRVFRFIIRVYKPSIFFR